MKKLTAVCLWLLWVSVPSCAWGPEGHRVIADVARTRLSANTLRNIRELLGNDDLAAVSTWADEIRRDRPETAGWHFVDIPWNDGGFLEPRDCYRPRDEHAPDDHQNCVVDRIQIFQRTLADKSAPNAERVEALKFLIHFVGDVHQPLHAIQEARGGNDIHVVAFGSKTCGSRPCNLHSLWDEGLIVHSGRSDAQYAAYLEELIVRRSLKRESGVAPAAWADESFHLAHEVWLPDGGTADEAYYRKNIGIVDTRLALAGVRLAELLNQCFERK